MQIAAQSNIPTATERAEATRARHREQARTKLAYAWYAFIRADDAEGAQATAQLGKDSFGKESFEETMAEVVENLTTDYRRGFDDTTGGDAVPQNADVEREEREKGMEG